MRIMDYLHSKNADDFILGLRLLNVDEILIEEYEKNVIINHSHLYGFFDNWHLRIFNKNRILLKIIDKIAEYEIIKKDFSGFIIKFIKLKEINYDNN